MPDVDRRTALKGAAAAAAAVPFPWPVGRCTAADIDPAHPGYEYWTAAADVAAPGAGVRNVQGGKAATATPSVDFRIWWDGDRGSELLDHTHVEKWDPATETSTRVFDPSGVASGDAHLPARPEPRVPPRPDRARPSPVDVHGLLPRHRNPARAEAGDHHTPYPR